LFDSRCRRGSPRFVQSTNCAVLAGRMSSGVMRAPRALFSGQVRITPAPGEGSADGSPPVGWSFRPSRLRRAGVCSQHVEINCESNTRECPDATKEDFSALRSRWHVCCIPGVRPPVWRAVVRPARYFFVRALLPSQSGKTADHRHECVEINRLRHVQIEACFDRGSHIPLGRIAGHRDGEHVTP
jgi:hypothetical protein